MILARKSSFLFKGKTSLTFQSTSLNAGVHLNWLQQICTGDIFPSLDIRKGKNNRTKRCLSLGEKVKLICSFLAHLVIQFCQQVFCSDWIRLAEFLLVIQAKILAQNIFSRIRTETSFVRNFKN